MPLSQSDTRSSTQLVHSRPNIQPARYPSLDPTHPTPLPDLPTKADLAQHQRQRLHPSLPISHPASHARSESPLLPGAVDTRIEQTHPLVTADTSVLVHIRKAIGARWDDHISMSRLSTRWRALYYGAEGTETHFWEHVMRLIGWEPSSTHAGGTAFLTVLSLLRHRRSCNVRVVRPGIHHTTINDQDISEVIQTDELEWIQLCSTGDGIWPPVQGSVCESDLVPHPLLSDLTLLVTPAPPGQTVLSQATIVDALDRPIPICSHPAFLQQISTWPATDSVEVDFVWGRGALSGPIGPVGLEAGRVAVQIGKRGSGRAVTIREFMEGVCDYWCRDLKWEDAKLLLQLFPEVDGRTRKERASRGGYNKFVGQIRKKYGRWRFLGDANILIGFFPSPISPFTRLTAYLASAADIEAYSTGRRADLDGAMPSSDGPRDVLNALWGKWSD